MENKKIRGLKYIYIVWDIHQKFKKKKLVGTYSANHAELVKPDFSQYHPSPLSHMQLVAPYVKHTHATVTLLTCVNITDCSLLI